MAKRKKTINKNLRVAQQALRAAEPENTVTFADKPAIVMAKPPVTRKLDLACGQNKREGFEGVDIFPGADICLNLMRYPWPFEDSSVAEVHCSHFVEHIPMIYVDDTGLEVPMGSPGAKDALAKFFDEIYRILVPEGWCEIIVPSGRSNRAFWDFTHRRFFVGESFFYLNAEWRKSQKLDHYNIDCDFDPAVNVTLVDPAVNTFHAEVQARHLNNYWNTTMDWHAKLKSRKPA